MNVIKVFLLKNIFFSSKYWKAFFRLKKTKLTEHKFRKKLNKLCINAFEFYIEINTLQQN